jgi:hypothetical protein
VTNRPSVPEIITVNSEALQTQIRDLLPSQNGFGSELQASNVIMPIIDLTAAAEGSGLPGYLQQALAFGSQTAFNAQNSTDLIENVPGFYRIFGTSQCESQSSGVRCDITITDGSTTKIVYTHKTFAGAASASQTVSFDFIVFLAAGESISAVSSLNEGLIVGSSRQLATGDGALVQPNGFPL